MNLTTGLNNLFLGHKNIQLAKNLLSCPKNAEY